MEGVLASASVATVTFAIGVMVGSVLVLVLSKIAGGRHETKS
jgi:hypothetical protein